MTIEITQKEKSLLMAAIREELRVLSEVKDRLSTLDVVHDCVSKRISEHLDLLHKISKCNQP